MRQSFLICSFVFLCLVSLTSCRSLKDPVFQGIDTIEMGDLSFSGSTLIVNMKYFNPNHSSGKIKEATGEAWIDSVYLGHFNVDSTISIPANSDFIIPVKLTVKMKSMLKNSLSLFMKPEVTVRLTGEVKAGTKGFYKRFPIKYEGKQNLQKLVE